MGWDKGDALVGYEERKKDSFDWEVSRTWGVFSRAFDLASCRRAERPRPRPLLLKPVGKSQTLRWKSQGEGLRDNFPGTDLPCPTAVGNHEADMTCGPAIWRPQVFLAGYLVWELLPTSFADHKSRGGIKCFVVSCGLILILTKSFVFTNPKQAIQSFADFRPFRTLSPPKIPLTHKVLQRAMFSNSSYLVAFLVSALSIGVQAATVKPSLSARQAAMASSSSSFSETSSFESSWQSLSQSFAQTQSVCQQQASFSVVYESVQSLYQSYQSAFNQYQSCSMCNTALAQSGFQTQFQQSVTQMYSSYQSIMTTSQQSYASQYQSQLLRMSLFFLNTMGPFANTILFTAIFQQMSSFGSFTQTIATSLSVDLKAILGGIGLRVDLFANIGLDLGGILGGSSGGGLLSGVLGGGPKSGGLLAGLLR
ncbi:hypothetical protein H4Q26_010532 [Puccinia striiformis f. sp. tritici PST-130]|nr:hypothetical protein H4Q26_010532 [Puccinia striiformis f. sp. tritici PST-130]